MKIEKIMVVGTGLIDGKIARKSGKDFYTY